MALAIKQNGNFFEVTGIEADVTAQEIFRNALSGDIKIKRIQFNGARCVIKNRSAAGPTITTLTGKGRLEVFTGYSETDDPTKVTVAANQITLTNGDRDEDYYVTKDYGAAYFTDLTMNLDVNVTALTAVNFCGFGCWALSNADDDLGDIGGAGGDALFIWLRRATANTHYAVDMYQTTGGVYTSIDHSADIAVGTPAYLAISRFGAVLSCEIYSSDALRKAAGPGNIDSLTGACITTAFQFIYGLASYNITDPNDDISGTVSNLDMRRDLNGEDVIFGSRNRVRVKPAKDGRFMEPFIDYSEGEFNAGHVLIFEAA